MKDCKKNDIFKKEERIFMSSCTRKWFQWFCETQISSPNDTVSVSTITYYAFDIT